MNSHKIADTAAVSTSDQSKPLELSFRLLIESAPDAMVLVNGDGLIVLANLQTENLFGYTQQELIGERVENLIPERFRVNHINLRSGSTLHKGSPFLTLPFSLTTTAK